MHVQQLVEDWASPKIQHLLIRESLRAILTPNQLAAPLTLWQ